jgi:hypothetical protein
LHKATRSNKPARDNKAAAAAAAKKMEDKHWHHFKTMASSCKGILQLAG